MAWFVTLPSDDIQPFITEASSSRQLLSSTPDSDFSHPLTFPSSLQLVGPGRRKGYFLYTDTNKDDFVHWWLRTAYGSTSGSLIGIDVGICLMFENTLTR